MVPPSFHSISVAVNHENGVQQWHFRNLHTQVQTVTHSVLHTCCCGDAISGHTGKPRHRRKLSRRWYRTQMFHHAHSVSYTPQSTHALRTRIVRSHLGNQVFVRPCQSLVICTQVGTNRLKYTYFPIPNRRCDTTL